MVFKRLFFLLIFSSACFAETGFHEPWGQDHDLHLPSKKAKVKSSLLAKGAGKIIHFYQNVISPTTGPRSSFRPTSSKYMQLAIQRYGFFQGFIMGCDRLLSENNETWVYPTLKVDTGTYKYDPAFKHKRTSSTVTSYRLTPELEGKLSR